MLNKLIWGFIALAILLASCDTVSTDDYDAPYDLTVQKMEDGKLKLDWKYSSSGVDIKFQIARRVGTGEWILVLTEDDSKTYIDDFADTESYNVISYKVATYNTEDEKYSDFSKVVSYFPVISQPSDLIISQNSQKYIELRWKDNALGETGYKVDKGVENTNGTVTWKIAYKRLNENITSCVDSVELAQPVYYRVYAYVGENRSQYIQKYINPTFPAPSNLTIEQMSRQQVRVAWLSNSITHQGFSIERRVGLDEFAEVARVVSDQVEYLDLIPVEAATLYYRIRAFSDTISYSAYSETAEFLFNIEKIGSVSSPLSGQDIFVKDNYAFIASNYNGVNIFDISNEAEPDLKTTIPINGQCLSVFAGNSKLYVTNSHNAEGLIVFDISDMDNLQQTDLTQVINTPYDIGVQEIDGINYAFVADGTAGIDVFDLNPLNPASPIMIKNISMMGVCYGVCVTSTQLYVAAGTDGVKEYDINSPYNISNAPVNSISGIGEVQDVFVYGGRVYVAAGENGLVILNRDDLSEIASIATRNFSVSVKKAGNFIYVADASGGLKIFDESNPDDIHLTAVLKFDTNVNSVFIRGNYAYLATDSSLEIIKINP